MRVLLACVAISLFVLAANAASTCFDDKGKCAPDECCIQDGKNKGECERRPEQNERCEPTPKTNPNKDYVYDYRCPCIEGLKCVPASGSRGKSIGKCQKEEK